MARRDSVPGAHRLIEQIEAHLSAMIAMQLRLMQPDISDSDIIRYVEHIRKYKGITLLDVIEGLIFTSRDHFRLEDEGQLGPAGGTVVEEEDEEPAPDRSIGSLNRVNFVGRKRRSDA